MEDKKMDTQEIESGYLRKLLKDMSTFEKYVAYRSKTDFFLDTQSDQTDKITKALTEFILEMPKLRRDQNAMGRYKYQGLPAMLEEINPVLAKYGLKAMQPPHTIGDSTYIITKIAHVSGQYFRAITAIPKEYPQAGKTVRTDQNLQAMGGAQTYVKRYALKAMLCIDADDDTDGGANTQRSSYGK